MTPHRMVKRPAVFLTGGRPWTYAITDVLSTLGTDKAVAIPLLGKTAATVTNAIRKTVVARSRVPIRLRSSRQGDDVLCWIEPKIEDPRPARRRVNGGSA